MAADDLLPVNGGLSLPRHIGGGESLVRSTGEVWDTLSLVEEDLRRLKVPELTEPTVESPDITAEMLLTPSINEYTVMYAATRKWYGYAARLLARIQAALLEVTNQLANVEAELRKGLREKSRLAPKHEKMNAAEIADEVKTDKDWQGLKLREQKLKQYRLEVRAWFDDLDHQLRVVSRQVEIRKEDNRGGMNEQNMPDRQAGYGLRRRT